MARRSGLPAALWIVFAVLAAGCTRAPLDHPRTPSFALADPGPTRLAKALERQSADHPGQSGFALIRGGMSAYLTRAALIDAADRTLDLQYYIFDEDITGKLLADRLMAAANRGVRVRLLVDDWNQAGQDDYLAGIDHHPNIEVRLFNPVGGLRGWQIQRPLDYIFGEKRIKRRMHNKALIADNAVAIVGGRNIADAYFRAGTEFNFGDMDLLAAGPVSRDVSAMFDAFWNDDLSVPASAFVSESRRQSCAADVLRKLDANRMAVSRSRHVQQVDAATLLRQWETGGEPALIWAQGQAICDRPEKRSRQIDAAPDCFMIKQLQHSAGQAQREALLISPYFVPGPRGVAFIKSLRDRGVSVKILTNSLASNDAKPAHGAYARYRADLLAMGVELYEMRPDPTRKPRLFADAGRSASADGGLAVAGGRGSGSGGSSNAGSAGSGALLSLGNATRASLHAKVLIVDRKTVFVGSINFDMRSMYLDTQNGIVVQSEELAGRLAGFFESRAAPHYAFRVALDPLPPGRRNPPLIWLGEKEGLFQSFRDEPMTTFWQRFTNTIASSLVPEQWL